MKLSKFLLAGGIAFGLIIGLAPAASATGNGPPDKGFVCHATGSETNPYVLLYVPLNSAHFDGHEGDVFFENTNRVPTCPGDEAEDGDDGTDGTDGTDGENGADGQDGVDGADGSNGVDGPQGPAGPSGPQGPAGKDADQTEIDNLRAVVTELNNRLFLLEHAVPAPVEVAGETVAPAAPVADEAPAGGGEEEIAFGGSYSLLIGGLGAGLAGLGLMLRRFKR